MRRVLILEDDADLRDTLADLFILLGADCCMAFSSVGELVLHERDIACCDLAVLDVNLGDGLPSGVDAYHWLRSRAFGGRIVFLTGHPSSHPLVRHARVLPDVVVFEKPLDSLQLEALSSGPLPMWR